MIFFKNFFKIWIPHRQFSGNRHPTWKKKFQNFFQNFQKFFQNFQIFFQNFFADSSSLGQSEQHFPGAFFILTPTSCKKLLIYCKNCDFDVKGRGRGGGFHPTLFFCRFAFFGSIRTTFSRDIFHFDPYFMSKSVLVIKKYLRLLCTNLRVCFYSLHTVFDLFDLWNQATRRHIWILIFYIRMKWYYQKYPNMIFFSKVMSNLNSPWSF